MDTCTACRFARPAISDNGEDPILKCHRYPAFVVFDGDGLVQVLPDAVDWCGEWAE